MKMLDPSVLDAAPKLTLGGKQYPMPLLAPRQNRIVLPLITKLMKSMIVDGKVKLIELSTEQFDELTEVVYVALTRGTPALTREQFLDEPVSLQELVASIDLICEATGVLKRGVAGKAPVATGEASGEATAGTSGMASSPA